MEEISQLISRFLSDPESMEQLQGVLSSLGLGEEGRPSSFPAGQGPFSGPGEQDPGGASPETQAMTSLLAPLLGGLDREDDNVRLLRALRPFLGEARQKKADEAIRILRLMRLFPLIRESGLLSGLL